MGELVMIEADAANANLVTELSLPRNSIVRKNNGAVTGTGPYVVTKWDGASKHMTLGANDQYWGGRPFLDSIEVEFGKNYRDQVMQLDLGKTDVAEITPEAIRPAQSGDRIVLTSQPEELMTLAFSRDAASNDERRLRSALAQSINTAALNNVIFQGGGEPTGALLPNWLSGYAFLFPTGGDIAAARRNVPRQEGALTLGYDPTDALARIIADRVVLNAHDAGILLQSSTSSATDIRLLRLELPSLDPQLALQELARQLQLPAPAFSNSSVAANYSAENSVLQTRRAIPLLHLRTAVATRPNVHGLAVRPDGTWNLSNVWLSAETP
jgi:MarR-like DNA-binding transcriptional regulator SgrR of sgrS sRNA